MITAVIIEDEAVAARRLEKMVLAEGLHVLAKLSSVQEAIAWFKKNAKTVNLIFLDIQLGDGLSFEIFEQVQPKSAIIFTTAYDSYAIKAFQLNSIDYLLKPINQKHLHKAIEKFNQQNQTINWDYQVLQNLINQNYQNPYKQRFLIKIGQHYKSINSQEIACIYSQDKATYLFTTEAKNYLLDESLDELKSQLNPNNFFRISRKAYIQMQHIQDIVAYSGSRLKVMVANFKQDLLVSRERVADFKHWLGK